MKTVRNQIRDIDYHLKDKEGLATDFETVLKLLAVNLTGEEQLLLNADFSFYLERGRWHVHNTFAGGIIFLREPETILGIKIEFDTHKNEAISSVEYASEDRNARNVKYKPGAGKIEAVKWNMLGVFPNFNKHSDNIKIILMSIIGKIVKRICEHYKKNSWFMEYEKEFALALFLDGQPELQYQVEI